MEIKFRLLFFRLLFVSKSRFPFNTSRNGKIRYFAVGAFSNSATIRRFYKPARLEADEIDPIRHRDLADFDDPNRPPIVAKIHPKSPIRNQMKLPNVDCTLAELRKNVDQMLADFRKKRTHTNFPAVLHATYLCNVTGRFDPFLEVIDEWFRQARPLTDEQSMFKASSNLCNLGKLNRLSGGRAIDRLGWEPIDYFLRRMIEIGFHRFHAEDIASALSGLHDLVIYSFDKKNNADISDQIPIRSIIDKWLRTFERYIRVKQPVDLDWSVLIRETAPLSLYYLNRMDSKNITTDHRALIELLLRLSKCGFEEISEKSRQNSGNFLFKSVYSSAIGGYAQFVNSTDIDPESIAPGSLQNWFECHKLAMLWKEFSLMDFGFSLQLATKYPQFRSAQFWPSFDAWYSHLVECLRSFAIDPNSGSSWNSYKKCVNLCYNSGVFLKISQHDAEFGTRRPEFLNLAFLVVEIFSSIDHYETMTTTQLSRLLVGLREFKRALDADSFRLSTKFYDRLHDWLVKIRGSDDARGSNEVANSVAAISHLLIDQQPPTYILDEAALSIYVGLRRLDDRDTAITLHLFGSVCLDLDFDPSIIQNGHYRLDDFWNRYFDKAGEFLKNSWSNSGASEIQMGQVLGTLPAVALRFGNVECFRRMKIIYEKRLENYLDYLSPPKCGWVHKSLSDLARVKNVTFSNELMEQLRIRSMLNWY